MKAVSPPSDQALAKPSDAEQRLLITYAVLIGLTPLIPIPLMDDWVKTIFRRGLVRDLAYQHKLNLTHPEVYAMARDDNSLKGGVISEVIKTLLVKISRKVLFVLEWRRAIHLVSHSYYYGCLVSYAFQRRLFKSGSLKATAHLNAAIERACKGTNTNLVRDAVKTTFNNSRDLIGALVNQISSSLRALPLPKVNLPETGTTYHERAGGLGRIFKRLPLLSRSLEPGEAEKIQAAVDQEKLKQNPGLQQVIAQIQARTAGLPVEHFMALQQRLMVELARPAAPTSKGR